jgi:hypothetical protein
MQDLIQNFSDEGVSGSLSRRYPGPIYFKSKLCGGVLSGGGLLSEHYDWDKNCQPQANLFAHGFPNLYNRDVHFLRLL